METYSIQDLSKTLATLDDLELWQRTTAAAQQEKHCCAVVIAHIAEVRKRKLFLLHACHSLFDYCVTVLGFSEAESYLRCQVAGICSRFPAVLADLAAGKISLCVAGKLAPRLSEKNQHRLLPACHGKTKQEAEIIIAKENPASLGKSPVNKTVILPLNEDFFAVRLPMHKNLLAKLQRCAELLGVASMQAQLPELLEKITDIALAAKDPAIKAAQRTARKNPKPPKAERKNSKPQTQIVAPQGSENSREQSAPDSPRLKKDVSSPYKKRSRTILFARAGG